MRCPKCGRAYAQQLLNRVMCIHRECSNYDFSWYRELVGDSDENGWLSKGLLPLEVRDLVGNVRCGYPHWFPKNHGFLADPVKQAVNGADWLWCVGTKLTFMAGQQLSCSYSASAPAWFRPKLAKSAQCAVDTLKKGVNADPYKEGKHTKTKWSDQLYRANSEGEKYFTATKVIQGDKSALFGTAALMSLVGGIPPGSGVIHRGIGPVKVNLDFLNGSPVFSAASSDKAGITTGWASDDKQIQKDICTEICLD